MSTKMDDLGEKRDWRLVAVALAGVVRPLSHEDELRRGWDAAAERARLAEADAETELRRAERAEADAAALLVENAELERKNAELAELLSAAKAQAPAVPVAGPNVVEVPRASTTLHSQAQINALYADLNALREKQLDTQARCDKAIQARIEAQRDRVAAVNARAFAEKERDTVAAQLTNARAGIAEHADQIKSLHSDLERAEAARDQAIKAGNKYRADVLHSVSEIESLRLKNKQLSNDVEHLRDTVDDARRARNEARAGLERVQAANAKLAAELAAKRAEAGASAEPETSQSAADRAGRLELVTHGQIIRHGLGGLAQVRVLRHDAKRLGHILSFAVGAVDAGDEPGPMRPVGVWAAEGWDVLP